MITFTCPACKAVCSLGDEFSGRKMKCPKCRTRIRHHKDGQIELLSMGEVPPPPGIATATTQASPAAPAAESPEKKGSTVEIPAVPEMVQKLVSQSESKQNTIVIAGVVGFLCLALAAIGLMTKDLILAVAPIAVGLGGAFVWLFIRVKKREALLAHPPAPKPAGASKAGDAPGDKTEPIAKA